MKISNSDLNFYKRWGAYSLDDKLCNAISMADFIITFWQVEKYHTNVSTVISVYNTCANINVMLPGKAGSGKVINNNLLLILLLSIINSNIVYNQYVKNTNPRYSILWSFC